MINELSVILSLLKKLFFIKTSKESFLFLFNFIDLSNTLKNVSKIYEDKFLSTCDKFKIKSVKNISLLKYLF